jgi:hypothetical protein
MIVAFLQALLNMLNQELRLLGKDAEGLSSPGKLLAAAASESPAPASPAPASPAPVARHKKHKQQ